VACQGHKFQTSLILQQKPEGTRSAQCQASKVSSLLHVLHHAHLVTHTCIGLASTIHTQCMYGMFGREITKYTVTYGEYIRFWPTLGIFGREITKYTVTYGVYIYGSGQP